MTTPKRRVRDVDAAARARALKIWIFAGGPGGFLGFLGGLYGGGSIGAALLGMVLATGGVGIFALVVTEGAGWSFARIHNPSGASTPHRPQFSRAESLVARERYSEAIEAYEAFIRKHPDAPEPYLAVARLLRDELGRNEEAVRWFKRARREARLDRKQEMLVSREIVETYRSKMEAPLRAAPELARACERFAGTPEGERARKELAELKELMERGGGHSSTEPTTRG